MKNKVFFTHLKITHIYFKMTNEELTELTLLIDHCNYENEDIITPISLHATWWPLLNKLRQAPNKAELLEGWKYKKELESSEYSHAKDVNKYINLEDWEQRFAVDLWLCIYH